MSKRIALFTILLYIAFAFIMWEWNPEKWPDSARLCFVLIYVLIDLCIYVMQMINEEMEIN